jgi:hypothetical protein
MLKDFGMENANPVLTPMDPHVLLEENKETGGDLLASQVYAIVIGKLLCAAHATHPYAVITLAQFTKNTSVTHRTAIKHIFRYLKGTMNHVLTYGRDGENWHLNSLNCRDSKTVCHLCSYVKRQNNQQLYCWPLDSIYADYRIQLR